MSPSNSSPQKSTIVRSKNSAEARLLRLRRMFRVLERAAPALGGRIAWRVWCTVPRPSPKAVAKSREGGTGEVRELRIALPDWRKPRPRTAAAGRPATLETRIAVELLGPADGPVVYLLHGWGGWRGQFAPIGRALAEAGHRVVLIDTPNHGDSGPGSFGPRLSLLPDFSLTLTAVAEEFGPARAVVAHSLGGGSAALALLEGMRAERAVFLSPAIDPVAYTRSMADMLGFGERIRTRMTELGRRRTGMALEEFALPPLLAGRADLPPALILHDEQDPVVPTVAGRQLAALWPDAELRVTSGLGHNRILRDETVVDAVLAFVQDARVPEPA